ncbi:PP2C family serine/threonine-protein phosphatase [Acinetobacter towneri]|uniref:PP2C family serine/threonine-protein phosphatase n=1 Tax=Acinetobacter towneri TaxID=202956 RepID=UPI001F194727|nr:hypothetical protein [Acinetobacter towneri]UIP25329.1 hypothetical protein LZG54_00915 [Acinetobacter towneri]
MNTPIKLVENLYISYGADGSDYIICTENNVVIYFIADGHSQRSGSADLIRLFIDYMNNHLPHENLTKFNVKQKICEHLRIFKETVKRKLPRAAMCFVIAVKLENRLHTFYLGDCRLGMLSGKDIIWITKPHSCVLVENPNMTEEELRLSEFNHLIYKQFSAIKFKDPDYFAFDAIDSNYILATDGFWKLAPEQQNLILDGKQVLIDDDIAFLKF